MYYLIYCTVYRPNQQYQQCLLESLMNSYLHVLHPTSLKGPSYHYWWLGSVLNQITLAHHLLVYCSQQKKTSYLWELIVLDHHFLNHQLMTHSSVPLRSHSVALLQHMMIFGAPLHFYQIKIPQYLRQAQVPWPCLVLWGYLSHYSPVNLLLTIHLLSCQTLQCLLGYRSLIFRWIP